MRRFVDSLKVQSLRASPSLVDALKTNSEFIYDIKSDNVLLAKLRSELKALFPSDIMNLVIETTPEVLSPEVIGNEFSIIQKPTAHQFGLMREGLRHNPKQFALLNRFLKSHYNTGHFGQKQTDIGNQIFRR